MLRSRTQFHAQTLHGCGIAGLGGQTETQCIRIGIMQCKRRVRGILLCTGDGLLHAALQVAGRRRCKIRGAKHVGERAGNVERLPRRIHSVTWLPCAVLILLRQQPLHRADNPRAVDIHVGLGLSQKLNSVCGERRIRGGVVAAPVGEPATRVEVPQQTVVSQLQIASSLLPGRALVLCRRLHLEKEQARIGCRDGLLRAAVRPLQHGFHGVIHIGSEIRILQQLRMHRAGDCVRRQIECDRVLRVSAQQLRRCNHFWLAVRVHLHGLLHGIALMCVGRGDPQRTCIRRRCRAQSHNHRRRSIGRNCRVRSGRRRQREPVRGLHRDRQRNYVGGVISQVHRKPDCVAYRQRLRRIQIDKEWQKCFEGAIYRRDSSVHC